MCVPVGDGLVKPEALNKKAIQIINRVRDKLTGECVSDHGRDPKLCSSPIHSGAGAGADGISQS